MHGVRIGQGISSKENSELYDKFVPVVHHAVDHDEQGHEYHGEYLEPDQSH